jgi:hypothetical protein
MNFTTGAAQYLLRYAEQTVPCNQSSLSRLGLDRSRCLLKVNEYALLCVPYQFGFKRSIFLASLSKQEILFFQSFLHKAVGLSMEFSLPNRQDPLKLFVRSSLEAVGQLKGRENVGLFVVDYKNTPEDYVVILGNYLEYQDRLKAQFEDYGKTELRMNPELARSMGFNMYATCTGSSKVQPNGEYGFSVQADPGAERRIQVFTLSSRALEHLEAANAPERLPGSLAAFQLYFQKYRVSVAGRVQSASRLATGLWRVRSSLDFSPELVEILDDYYLKKPKQ